MPNQQLLDFIKNQVQLGAPRDQIKSVLIQNGWTASDVDSAFLALEMPPTRPMAPASAPAATPVVAPVTPATPATPVSQPVSMPATPITQPVAQAAPVFSGNSFVGTGAASSITIKSSSGSGKKFIVGIIIAIIVVVIGGAGAWAYFNYVAPDPQTTINNSLGNLFNVAIQKGIVDGKGSLELKVSGNLPQNSSGLSTLDFTANSDVLSDLQAKKSSMNLSFSLALNAGPMLNANVNGQNFFSAIFANNKEYLKFELPSGLEQYASMSVTPEQLTFAKNEVFGKWIEIDKEQLLTLSQMAGGSSFASTATSFGSDPNSTTTIAMVKAFTDSNIFTVDQVMPSDTINGQSVFHYKVKLDKTGFTNFALAAAKISGNGQYPQGVTEQQIRDSIDQSFTQYDKMLSSGVKIDFDIYVERFSKMPVKMTLNIDASNQPELKQSGVISATLNASGSYDFPTSSNITEPTSFTTLIDLFTKIGMAFGPSAQMDTSSGQSTIVDSNQMALSPSQAIAKRARIQADVSQLRTYAEIIYGNSNSSYSSLCSGGTVNSKADPSLTQIVLDIAKAQSFGGQSAPSGISCVASQSNYAIRVTLSKSLVGSGITSYCVDSTGVMGDNRSYTFNAAQLKCM